MLREFLKWRTVIMEDQSLIVQCRIWISKIFSMIHLLPPKNNLENTHSCQAHSCSSCQASLLLPNGPFGLVLYVALWVTSGVSIASLARRGCSGHMPTPLVTWRHLPQCLENLNYIAHHYCHITPDNISIWQWGRDIMQISFLLRFCVQFRTASFAKPVFITVSHNQPKDALII